MRKITIEAIGAGTFGALVMMPFGFFFRALEMRVGHYGPKFASLYLEDPTRAALFMQHMVLGWVSALPLCLLPLHRLSIPSVLAIGSLYGVAYYVLVNSLGLPLYFGDPLPINLGVSVVIPSLVTHIAFGAAVSYGIYFIRQKQSAAP
jgi:hypothetical protein